VNKASFLKYLRTFNRNAMILGAIILGLFLLWHWNHSVDPAAVRERAKRIEEHAGIVIGLGAPDTFFVPPYTAVDARLTNLKATAVTIDAVAPALDGIEEALRVYPSGFFSEHCEAIFLCGTLTVDGAEVGGTWKKSWIVLSASKNYGSKGAYWISLYGVHHEFSSLIWTRFPEMQELWKALLPAGWVPARGSAALLSASDDLAPNPVDGFLSGYGATNPENDFNVYAETVFLNPSHVATQAEKHPVVAKKLALLMEAYIQLDKRFEGVFDRMKLLRFRSALPAPFREGILVSPIVLPKGQIVPSEP